MSSSKDLPPQLEPFFSDQLTKNQFRTRAHPIPKSTDLTGQAAIVTGSNTGLGLTCSGFATRVDTELVRHDVAIVNAGAVTGHEQTIQVNYLPTMLLGMLLRPALSTNSPTKMSTTAANL
ncbi:hypothetical protein SPBR_03870 [Sporothrix brasiliensis 5110]|uniref:Uncharacterized protein n=1 Tax=Sporothrix brasiliensis 5110 TaxID=1398154 RepID=A0A0C2J0I9_9PEZI|nr:uncharacterized protein SPBR_03870 [Sporothrix brasiliensis 5110]KIH94896.1 hypothetical protein SPBR_03870 [Sporothrix brasiliensis 5110]